MAQNFRLRRPISSLDPEERRAFFWCLKMLKILPPIPHGKPDYDIPTFS